MANFRFAVGRPFATVQSLSGDFVVPTAVNSSTTEAGYSADDVRHEHILRAWRSSDNTGAAYVSFATTLDVVAILIEHFNAVDVTVGGATNAALTTSFSAFGTSNSRTSASINPITGRHSLIGIGSSASSTNFGVKFSGGTIDGADYYLGRMCMVTSFTEIAQNFGVPYSITSSSQGSHKYFPGGMTNSQDLSENYAVLELNGQFSRAVSDNTEATLRGLQRSKATQRILFYENRSNPSSGAYLCHRANEIEIVEAAWPLLECDVVLREVT